MFSQTSHCSANLMEMILVRGVEVGAEDGELGGMRQTEKDEKKSLISVWVESTFLLLASPETIRRVTRS